MKRQIIYLLFGVITSISLYMPVNYTLAIQQDEFTYTWWDFNGSTTTQMSNNAFYTPDPDNSPDCPPTLGSIYCEVYAQTDGNSDPDDPKPDLLTISNTRMRF
jgi:hypothetical protein